MKQRVRVLAVLAAIGLSFVPCALCAAAALAITGELTQLPGTDGCVSDTGSGGSCSDANGLNTPMSVVVSPDRTSVYAASSDYSAVAVFSRNTTTGALTQPPGTAGCVTENSATVPVCADGKGLGAARSVAVSPDGKSVYVASQGASAVAAFSRDATTGQLTQLPGTDGCVSNDGSGGECAEGKALEGADSVAVSPDGKSVYVASFTGDGVAEFSRNKTTGALTQPSGDAACVAWVGSNVSGCAAHKAMDGPRSVAVSPDGKSVYVAAAGSSNAVDVLARNTTSGKLTPPAGTAACISDDGSSGDCEDGKALLGASSVAVSRDKKSVYVASAGSSAVAVFSRNTSSGKLKQLAGTDGCVSDGGAGNCGVGELMGGADALAVSRDKKSVYVAARDNDAVDVLARNTTTGALTQLAEPTGCVSSSGSGGRCRQGKLLTSPRSVAVSSERKPLSVYVTSIAGGGDDGMAVFKRSP